MSLLYNRKTKKMRNPFYISILIISSVFSFSSYAQTLPVGTSIFDGYYRRAQLLGDISDASSFTNRPIFSASLPGTNLFDPDSTIFLNRKTNFDGIWKFDKEKGIVQLLPIEMLNQFNSHHPDGINDGSMIPSKGYQTKISAGVYLKYRFLSVQFRPEFVFAQNIEFGGFPEKSKIFWGQSSIRTTLGPISFGLSNENLWWGPGYRNSLLMTNHAPGFMHLTLNTIKPIKTYIGSFEWQIIAGKLEESGLTDNLQDDWNYINSMVLSYNPKWFPGLFLGMTRSFVVLKSNMGSKLGDYLPVFSFLMKSSGPGEDGSEVDAMGQNQLISVFMRWLFTEVHGEIYLEYGREDHSRNLYDFILEPSHSSAYILGLRKLFSLNKQKETYYQLILETTHLSSPQATINRNRGGAGEWYQHGNEGYTHLGQVLGAGIGGGGNLQTFDISWVKSLKQIGIQVERYVHNNDHWYNSIKDIRANWVDISTAAYASWDYNNFLFTIKLKYISSFNYQWIYEPQFEEGEDEFWAPSDNTPNFHGQIGLMYRF